MATTRMAVCGTSLLLVSLWLPSDSGAGSNCQAVGNDVWKQWGQGSLPKNDVTIDTVMKVKNDCPQLAGSMDRIANDIKAQREKLAEAVAIVRMAVEELTKKPASTGQEGNQ